MEKRKRKRRGKQNVKPISCSPWRPHGFAHACEVARTKSRAHPAAHPGGSAGERGSRGDHQAGAKFLNGLLERGPNGSLRAACPQPRFPARPSHGHAGSFRRSVSPARREVASELIHSSSKINVPLSLLSPLLPPAWFLLPQAAWLVLFWARPRSLTVKEIAADIDKYQLYDLSGCDHPEHTVRGAACFALLSSARATTGAFNCLLPTFGPWFRSSPDEIWSACARGRTWARARAIASRAFSLPCAACLPHCMLLVGRSMVL